MDSTKGDKPRDAGWPKTLLAGMLLGLDACWLYVIIALSASLMGLEWHLSWLALLGLLASAYFSAQLFQHLDWPLRLLRAAAIALAGIAIVTTVGWHIGQPLALFDLAWMGSILWKGAHPAHWADPEMVAAAMGVGLWWWGTHRAQEPLTSRYIRQAFLRGLFPIIAALIIASAGAGMEETALVALAFCGLGLVALPLAYLIEISPQAMVAGGSYWLGILGSMAIVVLLIGVALGGLAILDLSWLGRPLGWLLWGILDVVLYIVFLPITYLMGLLAGLLLTLRAGFSLLNLRLPDIQGVLEQLRREGQEPQGLPDFVVEAIGWSLLVLLVGLVVLWLAWSIMRRRGRSSGMAEEFREDLTVEGPDWGGLMAWLRGLGSRAASVLPSWVGLGPGPDEARTVRRIYRSLLALGATLGRPRQLWQTPLEHEPPLSHIFGPQEVHHITDVFTKVRYGRYLPSQDEAQSLQQDWERIRTRYAR